MIYEEIFREFQRQGVQYVVVGGIAFNLLGGLRTTADLDLLVALSDRNLLKIIKILKKNGYRVKQPVEPLQLADRKTREDWILHKHMKAFNFYKEEGLKEVDLIIDSPVSYDKAKHKIRWIYVGRGLKLPIVSIDHLIQMKKAAGRNVDQWDIIELKKIKKLQRKK